MLREDKTDSTDLKVIDPHILVPKTVTSIALQSGIGLKAKHKIFLEKLNLKVLAHTSKKNPKQKSQVGYIVS